MKTCAYCGSEVIKVTDRFHCDFCDMILSNQDVAKDGQRKDHTIEHVPFEYDFYKSTPELMQLKTLELLYLLKFARQTRSDIYNTRILGHKAGQEIEAATEILDTSFSEYEKATRKVWVIENIIKDRIGYYPKKITDDFLDAYLERIERSQLKKMVIKQSVAK